MLLSDRVAELANAEIGNNDRQIARISKTFNLRSFT
jgi:hypothetical protein